MYVVFWVASFAVEGYPDPGRMNKKVEPPILDSQTPVV